MPTLQNKVETLALRAALSLPEPVQRLLAGRAVTLDGDTLATDLQLLLRLQKLAGQPCLGERPLAESRAMADVQGQMLGGSPRIGEVRELTVEGAEGDLPARLYVPTSRLGADRVPTLMFLHGGGHALGSLDSHDAACRHLAEQSAVQVLAIDYRQPPETPFPGPVDDCFAAYQWLVKNVDAIAADPDRLAVGGDSAGGNLAAATAILAAEHGLPLAWQLLIYPVTDLVNRSRSRDLLDGGDYYLSRTGMDRLLDWYAPDGVDRAHPLLSVGLRTGFPPGLAPAYVVTAGFDPLRDEGEAYARLLAEHGVSVEAERFGESIHTFINHVGLALSSRDRAVRVAEKLRKAMS